MPSPTRNRLSRPLEHPVQAIMSRTGSFPVGIAKAILTELAPKNAVVLDPFCGKGTTLLAGRCLGHATYGSDVAPEAVWSARAKVADVCRQSVTEKK